MSGGHKLYDKPLLQTEERSTPSETVLSVDELNRRTRKAQSEMAILTPPPERALLLINQQSKQVFPDDGNDGRQELLERMTLELATMIQD